MKFHYDVKKDLVALIILSLLMLIFAITCITMHFVNTGSYNPFPSLNTGIAFLILSMICLIFLLYGFGYSVEIKENELTICLCYIKRKYDLNDLRKYSTKETRHYAIFILYFKNKKRTITTTKKVELMKILDYYIPKPENFFLENNSLNE